ncbi:hypothetical protein ACIRL2_06560 [Embleya sp. NPDC127516]|uniref:hypothetical protein n=1 Tax=Embleya sp. NPDC127516 TaxID=3363990 RepID=UPI0037FBF2EF
MHYASAFALLAALDNADGEVFARVRGTYAPHLGEARGLPAALITSVIRYGTGADLIRAAARNPNIRVTTEVLAEARPAVAALRFLRHCAAHDAFSYLRPTTEVTALLERHLGADPRAWSRLLALLPDCQGTVAELVKAAGVGTGGTEVIPTPPRTVATEWRQLLLSARPELLTALVPHLRPRTVLDLVHFGALLPGPIVAEVVRRATPKQRLALAAAGSVRAEAHDALIDLGVPEVNAAVYNNPRAGDRERNRIMAAAGTVPLDPDTRTRALRSDNIRYRRPGVWSGDPTLVRAALLRVRQANVSVSTCIRTWEEGGTQALRPLFRDTFGNRRQHEPFVVPVHRAVLLGALLALWDRHGVAGAASLVEDLPLREGPAAKLRAMFEAGEEGRARLRAEYERGLARRSPRSDPPRVPQGFLIGAPWDPRAAWSALEAAHAQAPLPAATARYLTALPDCPAPIAEAADDGEALRERWPVGGGWRRVYPHDDSYTKEVRRLRVELTKIPDLAERVFIAATPAERALELYDRIQRYAPEPESAAAQRARMAEYIREYLGEGLEARVIAARMAPSFAGTLPELFATAAAAAG